MVMNFTISILLKILSIMQSVHIGEQQIVATGNNNNDASRGKACTIQILVAKAGDLKVSCRHYQDQNYLQNSNLRAKAGDFEGFLPRLLRPELPASITPSEVIMHKSIKHNIRSLLSVIFVLYILWYINILLY